MKDEFESTRDAPRSWRSVLAAWTLAASVTAGGLFLLPTDRAPSPGYDPGVLRARVSAGADAAADRDDPGDRYAVAEAAQAPTVQPRAASAAAEDPARRAAPCRTTQLLNAAVQSIGRLDPFAWVRRS